MKTTQQTFESVLRSRVLAIQAAIQGGYDQLTARGISSSQEDQPEFVEKLELIEARAIHEEVSGLMKYSPTFWVHMGDNIGHTENQVFRAVMDCVERRKKGSKKPMKEKKPPPKSCHRSPCEGG
jgi:hypothetical protein